MFGYNEMFQRNLGILTVDQQMTLRGTKVAIAGVGGVGGIAAERLARLGIGSLRIADPEVFEPSNINRQFGSGMSTLGSNKADTVGQSLRDINPSLDLEVWQDGITPANVNRFVSKADAIVDEVEYGYLDVSVALHRAARLHGKYVMFALAIGFGSTLFVFDPDGMTFEQYISLPAGATDEEIRAFHIPVEKMCPSPPDYADPQMAEKIIKGEQAYMPTVSVGCSVAGSLIVAEVAAIILNLRKPRVIPDCTTIDLIRQAVTICRP